MRSIFLMILAILTLVPALGATEIRNVEPAVPHVTSSRESEPSSKTAGLQLTKVAVEERQASSDAAAAQLGPRGGFWWTVGVIVVAIVIVSVIL